jgi:signal transduction histidine kinase
MGYTLKTTVSSDVPFVQPNDEGEATFRVIAHKLHHQSQTIGWVVVGLPIERIEESMQHLLQVLLTGIPLVVLCIGIGGYFLTGKILHPIDIITKKANYISSSNLNERIEVKNSKDELGRLTIVLNALLERLYQSFENQRAFLADAAHELKTPLSILRSHWEDQLNNPDLTLEFKENLLQDVETITRLNHLINNLLLLSKTESMQASFDFSAVQLDELIDDVVTDARILADIKSQQISIQKMHRVIIMGDRQRLFQLFFNIIDNAIKYTPDKGHVWITLDHDSNWVIVSIRDDGIGITAADLPHIFDRFYRVDKDRARQTGGSGLGLAICKLIAEFHGGHIDVTSKAGHGTLFKVKLPRTNS